LLDLRHITYYSVPEEQIPTKIQLGPPKTYEVQEYGDGSILRIGHAATTWWGAFRVYTTDSPAEYSAVRETSAEFRRSFQVAHVQQAPYVVSQSGSIADLSSVKWICPVWEERKQQLGFLLAETGPPNPERPSVAFRYAGTGIEFRVQRSRDTQFYRCDCSNTASVFRLSPSTTSSAASKASDTGWQPLQINHFPKSFILVVDRGPAYVATPNADFKLWPTRWPVLLVPQQAYRDVRFFDKGLLLLLPFTAAIDIVTAPISIPLLLMSLEGMRRMH
jgi:hypothetical protein